MTDPVLTLVVDTSGKNSLSDMPLCLPPQKHFEEFFRLIQGLSTKPSSTSHIASLTLSHTHQTLPYIKQYAVNYSMSSFLDRTYIHIYIDVPNVVFHSELEIYLSIITTVINSIIIRFSSR